LYLCTRNQEVAGTSEGCGSAKLERARLCILGRAKRPLVERALHFPCTVDLVGGAPAMRDKRVSNIILGGAKRQSRANQFKNLNYLEYGEDFL